MIDGNQLEYLIEMRSRMFTGESTKQKEIIDKLDELILATLNTPEAEQETE